MRVKLTLVNGTLGIGTSEHLNHETEIVEVIAWSEASGMVGKAWPIMRRRCVPSRSGTIVEYEAAIYALVVTAELLPG